MFFDFGDKKIAVSFGHSSQVVKGGQFKGRAKVTTWCKIKDVTSPTDSLDWIGVAVQNPIDNHNKFFGRKLAFERAMNNYVRFPVDDGLTKEQRRQIWMAVSEFIGVPNQAELVRD